jgi:DNA-directed RNA polymerase subunit alpha
MIKFEKPQYKVTEYVESNSYGKFELEPLEKGFARTLGNALRRVMLSSLPGSAITSVYIDGVSHEFATIDGIYEDVTSIILALKGIVIKNHSEEDQVLTLNVDKEGVVTAGDISCPSDIEIINKDHFICTIVKGGKLSMEMTVSNGRGYVRAEENQKLLKNAKLGTIAIDSIYSPIERVNYYEEDARVGQATNFDKLIMEIWTNGSIKPEESIALASRILIEHFNILTDLNEIADITGLMAEKEEDPKVKALETSIDDMEFSVRAYNCLKRSNINTMQDLVNMKESEIMKIRNLGKKSLKEVIDKVKSMGLSFKAEE